MNILQSKLQQHCADVPWMVNQTHISGRRVSLLGVVARPGENPFFRSSKIQTIFFGMIVRYNFVCQPTCLLLSLGFSYSSSLTVTYLAVQFVSIAGRASDILYGDNYFSMDMNAILTEYRHNMIRRNS